MDNQTTNNVEKSKTKKVIIVLIVLLLISCIGLAARYLYLKNSSGEPSTSTAPGNTVGKSVTTGGNKEESAESAQTQVPENNGSDKVKEAVKIELHQSKTNDNTKFEVENMLPGDTVSKYFEVKVYHKSNIELFFAADVTEQTKNLADALNIKVTREDIGSVLMDKPFALADGKEVSQLLNADGDEQTTARFRIDVSLDKSVGNEYQNALLKSDFKWYVKDDGSLVNPPKTGDEADIILWILIADIALILSLALVYKKQKGGKCHG